MRTTLKEKGQVTMPVAVRNILGVKTGDIFEVEVLEGKVVLTPQKLTPADAPARQVDLDSYFGALKGHFGEVEAIDRLIREGRDEWN